MKITILLLISFILGILFNEFISKKATEIKTYKDNQKIQENTQTLEEKNKISKISNVQIIKLPHFIKRDIKKYNFNPDNFKEAQWNEFLELQKINELNKIQKDFSLIHTAVYDSNLDFLKYLNNLGVNLNDNNKSAISTAFEYSDYETIEFLINTGADLNTIDYYGNDLLALALRNKKNYDTKSVQLLLDNGFNINTNPEKYFSSLIYNMNTPNKKYLKELVSNVDPNTKLTKSKDYLELALESTNNEEVIDSLLEKYEITNADGYNALHITSSNRSSIDLLEKFIKKGFDINSKTEIVNQTPLMYAIKDNNLRKVELLLKNGADISILDFKGNGAKEYVEKYIKDDSKKKQFNALLMKYNH